MGGGANTDDLLIVDVEVAGRRVDVLVSGGRIARIGAGLSVRGERFDGAGGALLPGLHDHHLHLIALAAARSSLDLAAIPAPFADALQGADRELADGRWLRVVGYHESMAGDLDRDALDAIVPGRPVRVQHRSGALWVLNSAAIAAVGTAIASAPPGFDAAKGHCWRIDRWLRAHVPPLDIDVAATARELRDSGVTGITDMTPYEVMADASPLVAAADILRIVMTGAPTIAGESLPVGLVAGPVKILLEDHDPPEFEDLVEWVRAARRVGRTVAVHCVTRAALALMVAVWDAVGAVAGDRVEHGAVVPPDLATRLAAFRVTVVTQPSFVACRGDEYLSDVDADDVPHLWPVQSLLDAGVTVAASTDAPFGPADAWAAIAAASTRRTTSGQLLGGSESVDALRALDMFLGDPNDPGGRPRQVEVGASADLCLLDRPLADALAAPSASHVRTTWLGGRSALR